MLRPCWAVATSGVPVREQLFNASICHHSPFNLFQHGEFSRSFSRTPDLGSLEVATPILIPRKDGHRHRKGSHGDIIFLTNRGEVSSSEPNQVLYIIDLLVPNQNGISCLWNNALCVCACMSVCTNPSIMLCLQFKHQGMIPHTCK